MRVLVTADLHQGRTTFTASRADDFAATLMRFAKKAVELKVDVVLIVGDIFHSKKPSPKELHALTSALRVLQVGEIETYIVPGNHDGPDTVGDSRTSALAWMQALTIEHVHVFIDPFAGQAVYGERLMEFNLVAIPYPHKNSFDALRPEMTQLERTEEISRKLEGAIDTMLDKVKAERPDLPTIFMGHLSVIGGELGSEQNMRFGMDVTVRSSVLDKADFAALGHLHKQQHIGEKCWYAGSPEYMTFGEIGHPKGFLDVVVEAGKKPVVSIVDSEPRPMVKVDIQAKGDEWTMTPASFPDGAIVGATIHPELGVTLTERQKTRIERALRQQGAWYVRIEVEAPEEERAVRMVIDPQVATEEAVRSYLESRNEPLLEPALAAAREIIHRVGEAA